MLIFAVTQKAKREGVMSWPTFGLLSMGAQPVGTASQFEGGGASIFVHIPLPPSVVGCLLVTVVVVVVVVVGVGVLRTNQVSAYGRSPLDQGKWRSDRDAARPTRRCNRGVTDRQLSAAGSLDRGI